MPAIALFGGRVLPDLAEQEIILRGMLDLRTHFFDRLVRQFVGDIQPEAIRAARKPVSYTHLDVYKRQGLSPNA